MKMRKKNDTAVYSTGTKVIRFLVVLLMSFVAFLTLYPIFYVVLGAFKKNQELLTGGINIFPSEWIVQNFIDAWNSANFADQENISCLCSSRRDEHNAPERRIHMDFYRQFKQWTQCYRSYIYKHKCHKQTIDQFLAPEIFTGKYISCHACDN